MEDVVYLSHVRVGSGDEALVVEMEMFVCVPVFL